MKMSKSVQDDFTRILRDMQTDGAEIIGEVVQPNSWYVIDDRFAMFTPVCRKCGKQFFIAVFKEDLDKYNNGELVQDAFPYLSADDREMIMSQMCPVCWAKIFQN